MTREVRFIAGGNRSPRLRLIVPLDKIDYGGVFHLNPTAPIGASNLELQKLKELQVYKWGSVYDD
jgi:hypothetical protein